MDTVVYKGNLLKHISSRLTPFSTRIFPLATHQESNKDSSRAKPEDSYERTPQKQHLRKTNIKNIKSRLKESELKKTIKCQIYRKVIGIEANKRHLQTNIAFRDTLSTMGAMLRLGM